MASTAQSSSPAMLDQGPDALEQLAPLRVDDTSTDSAGLDSSQLRTPIGSSGPPNGPHHQHSRSQPYLSSADIYAASQLAGSSAGASGSRGSALGSTISDRSRRPQVASKSLAHSSSSSLEFLAGQDDIRVPGQPYNFGISTPTTMSTNTKRASVLSFQTALSGSIANYLSADDSGSGSAKSSPQHRTKPLPASEYGTGDRRSRNSSGDSPYRALRSDAGLSNRNYALTGGNELDFASAGDGYLPASDTITTIKNPDPFTHSGPATIQTEESLQSAIPDFPPPVGVSPADVYAQSPHVNDDDGVDDSVDPAFTDDQTTHTRATALQDTSGTVRRPKAHRSQPSLASYANAITPKAEIPGNRFDQMAAEQLNRATAGILPPSAPVSDFRARPLANIESSTDSINAPQQPPVAAALLPGKTQFTSPDLASSHRPIKSSDSTESPAREASPPPDGEVEARAEWERAQMLRSKMVSPTMGSSPLGGGTGTISNTMTSRDRDSLRDSFRESLMMNGTSSPSSTTSPRGSRGKLNLRPLHLVNAAAAGTSAVDVFNSPPSGNAAGANNTTPGSPPLGPKDVGSAGSTANRRSSGLWSGPGSPPFNGMRTVGNRSSVQSNSALFYIDSSGNTVNAAGDITSYRNTNRNSFQQQQQQQQQQAGRRGSAQLQSPIMTSPAAMYASSPSLGSGPGISSPGQLSRAGTSPALTTVQQLQAQLLHSSSQPASGAATPLLAAGMFGSTSGAASAGSPTAAGALSAHATAQQHSTVSPEQIQKMAAEAQLASLPSVLAPQQEQQEQTRAGPDNGVDAAQAELVKQQVKTFDLNQPPSATLPETPAGQQNVTSRSRSATLGAKSAPTSPPLDRPMAASVAGAGQKQQVTSEVLPGQPQSSHVNVTTQQLQKQQQREQRRSASGLLALAAENGAAVPGINGGPYPVFPSPAGQQQQGGAAGANGSARTTMMGTDKMAASSAALQAAIEQVQFLQNQAVAGVGTRPPAEIAAMAAQAQALANQQARMNSIRTGIPREAKAFPGVQPQPSLVPPFELQHRPDGLPSAMIGPDGVRRSLNDPEVCLECMMRDEDMIDVHVNATAFWERESDAQFEEGCRLEHEDEDRRKSGAMTPSGPRAVDGSVDGNTTAGAGADGATVDGTAPPTTAGGHDGASVQTASTKVESGFGVTHVVGQTGISISPRDAMGMVRIGGSRMRVKRIAKGDPLTAERLKLHTQMNPPASSHRWRALQNFLATQAKYIAMEQRARYEAAAAAEREAVASGQPVPNVQYDNKIIRGATTTDAKARQTNGIYLEEAKLDPTEQEQKARDIAKAQDLRKRNSQRASVMYDPEFAPRLNQQLPPVPVDAVAASPASMQIPAQRRVSVPSLVEPTPAAGGETPNMGLPQSTQFNTPVDANLSPIGGVRHPALAATGAGAASLYSNGEDRLAHAALSPGSPLGPPTPNAQVLGSPMSIGRAGYGFPDNAGGASSPPTVVRTEPDGQRPSSLGAEDSLNKGRGKGIKKLLSKVAGGSGADGESARSGSLDADENAAEQSGKGLSVSQKRSASALGLSSPVETAHLPEDDSLAKQPIVEVPMPPGGYYNDPSLAASQTSLDIGPFQNPVPPPRIESKTIAQAKRAVTRPESVPGLDAEDAFIADLASRPARPARNSNNVPPSASGQRGSSEMASPSTGNMGSPTMNGNSTFGSRMSAQSLGSATLEAARKSVSSLRGSLTSNTQQNQQQFASTTPSMASLREAADSSTASGRTTSFGATPTPSRSRNSGGSKRRESQDWLKPSEQRSTPRKRSFFFRRSKLPAAKEDEDDSFAPRNMPARPMTSMGLHGEGSGLGRAREVKAASRFQRILGGLFGGGSKKKRQSVASGAAGSADFDPFNRAGASSRASGFLKSGGLSLPRLLRSRNSNSNMDKPLSLEKGIGNNDPIPNLSGFSGARDERGLPLRAQSAMGRLPSQKFVGNSPSFSRPTWASPRSFDEDDEDAADAEMRRDPLASKRKGLGGSQNRMGNVLVQDLLKSPVQTQFGASTSSIATTSFSQYPPGTQTPRLPVRQSSRGSNMKANINMSLPGVHEI
ncbi:hypothetical protein OC845_004469 [Tilletia horrida]|nr:hypothetical protein OC845_004469 [Tilletia horrida]